jgi:hypothetical protein
MFSGEIRLSRIVRDEKDESSLRENPPDRPQVDTITIIAGPKSYRMRVEGVRGPLMPFEVVGVGGGRTIGGGTSREAVSRARRKMAANGRA